MAVQLGLCRSDRRSPFRSQDRLDCRDRATDCQSGALLGRVRVSFSEARGAWSTAINARDARESHEITRQEVTAAMEVSVTSLDLDIRMFVRLLIAVVLGALVGYERERAGKPAGVRTHGMVSLGAALFAVVSLHGFAGAGDTARVAAQIVTGIGFIGAGAILHDRTRVHVLTTAASLWVTAAIGLAIGVGMVVVSVATTLLVFVLLRFGPRPGLKRGQGCAE